MSVSCVQDPGEAAALQGSLASQNLGLQTILSPLDGSNFPLCNWELFVTPAKEFRAYADERLDWAKTARTDHERKIFMQMAKTWMEVAALAAGIASLTAPSPSSGSVPRPSSPLEAAK